MRGLTSKIDKFRKYRTIMRHLDSAFPDATPEEVAALPDQICIICREPLMGEEFLPQRDEEGQPGEAPRAANAQGANGRAGAMPRVKKLPCGHVFHMECLRGWLPQAQNCPLYCRQSRYMVDLQIGEEPSKAAGQVDL